MPKISEEQRAARRLQIVEAAWTCFDRTGIHGTSMSDIIHASGLSAGAVYLYFTSKEEIILAAVIMSLGALARQAAPLLEAETVLPPTELIAELIRTIDSHTRRGKYNLRTIAIHGWSESQSNERVKAAIALAYKGFRGRLVQVAHRWQAAGLLQLATSPEAIAKSMVSLLLGYLVQSAILGDVTANEIADGLTALGGVKTTGSPRTAATPARSSSRKKLA